MAVLGEQASTRCVSYMQEEGRRETGDSDSQVMNVGQKCNPGRDT